MEQTAEKVAKATLFDEPNLTNQANLSDLETYGGGGASPAFHRFRLQAHQQAGNRYESFHHMPLPLQEESLAKVQGSFMRELEKQGSGKPEALLEKLEAIRASARTSTNSRIYRRSTIRSEGPRKHLSPSPSE